jgi:hypothetical protein
MVVADDDGMEVAAAVETGAEAAADNESGENVDRRVAQVAQAALSMIASHQLVLS